MGHTTTELRQAEELLGAMFTTPKELRHLAEQSLGQLFVPTEVIHEDEQVADLVLRPAGMGTIHVHAERERSWYPFHITRVDVIGGD
jgi:hypothetical protein